MAAKPHRRWFQFSLKALLIGMTVLCVGPGGYVAYEQAKGRKQMAAFRAVNEFGGYFALDGKTPVRSIWARWILGDDTAAKYTSVLFVRSHPDGRKFTFQDDCLRHLAKLPKINDVALADVAVSDAGLVHLAKMKGLKAISLKNTKVTDAGVAQLQKELPDCRIIR